MTETEEKLSAIFMDIVKPTYPDVTSENIIVTEKKHARSEDPIDYVHETLNDLIRAINVLCVTGKDIDPDADTYVEFENMDIDPEHVQNLRETLADLTRYHIAYGPSFIQFCGKAETFLNSVDKPYMKHCLQTAIAPKMK